MECPAPPPLEWKRLTGSVSPRKREEAKIDMNRFLLVAVSFSGAMWAWQDSCAGGIPEGVVYVCDSTHDRVLRFWDRDGSGAVEFEATGEIQVLYDDSSLGPDLSVPSHLQLDAEGRLYLLDGGTLDAVLVLRDANEDGDWNDEGELNVFYDGSGAGPRLMTPNTMLLVPDGSLLISDDGSNARRIVRLVDLNGDGDALDEAEGVIVYDSSATGPVLLEDPESLALGSEGELYVGDSNLGAVARLVDRDGNGDFLGDDEASVFFQSSGKLLLADIDALVAAPGGEIYACDEDSGLILRLMDVNGDGDAEDPAEATPFVDSPQLGAPKDMLLLPDGGLLIADNRSDSLYVAVDLNEDGDALDEGELYRWVWDNGESLATPHGLAFGPEPSLPPPHGFLRGDANDDSRVDISDAVAILDYLFLGGVISVCLDVLDADDSGGLNISDPIYVLNFLFNGGTSLPPPFPVVGSDPTADSLGCPNAP